MNGKKNPPVLASSGCGGFGVLAGLGRLGTTALEKLSKNGKKKDARELQSLHGGPFAVLTPPKFISGSNISTLISDSQGAGAHNSTALKKTSTEHLSFTAMSIVLHERMQYDNRRTFNYSYSAKSNALS